MAQHSAPTTAYVLPDGSVVEVPHHKLNPSVARYGPGPAGFRCGSCANLSAVHVVTRQEATRQEATRHEARGERHETRHEAEGVRHEGPASLMPRASRLMPPIPLASTQTIYYCCLDGQPKRVSWPACDRFVEAPLPTNWLKADS